MALQRLDLTPTPHPLGEALGNGLEAIAGHKMRQIQRIATGDALEAAGYPRALAGLHPDLSKTIIGGIDRIRQQQQQQQMQQQQIAQLRKSFEQQANGQNNQSGNDNSYLYDQIQQQLPPQQQEALPFQNAQRQLFDQNAADSFLGQPSGYQMPGILGLVPGNFPGQQQSQQNQVPEQTQPNKKLSRNKQSEPLDFSSLQYATSPREAYKQGNELIKQNEKKKIADRDYEYKINKDAREFVAPYAQRAAKGKETIKNSKALIKAAETGNLRAGNVHQLLDKIGFGQFNQNVETQVAQKVAANMALESAGVFGPGARITNFLEQTFQKTLPSLWNTPEGIIGVAHVKIAEAKVLEEESRIANSIIRENDGLIPPDIHEQIETQLKPFRDNVDNEVTAQLTIPSFPDPKTLPKEMRNQLAKDMHHEVDGLLYNIKNGRWVLVGAYNG